MGFALEALRHIGALIIQDKTLALHWAPTWSPIERIVAVSGDAIDGQPGTTMYAKEQKYEGRNPIPLVLLTGRSLQPAVKQNWTRLTVLNGGQGRTGPNPRGGSVSDVSNSSILYHQETHRHCLII